MAVVPKLFLPVPLWRETLVALVLWAIPKTLRLIRRPAAPHETVITRVCRAIRDNHDIPTVVCQSISNMQKQWLRAKIEVNELKYREIQSRRKLKRLE